MPTMVTTRPSADNMVMTHTADRQASRSTPERKCLPGGGHAACNDRPARCTANARRRTLPMPGDRRNQSQSTTPRE
eukprot:5562337-Alexandrium_andersonii.AAC.1